MTVKELKEQLELFPDDLTVMVPNNHLHLSDRPVWYVPANNIAMGINEEDWLLFIEYLETEED